LNPKIPDVGVGERLAAAVAAMQRVVSVCVRGIGIGSFVSGLLFVGIESEIQREGVCVSVRGIGIGSFVSGLLFIGIECEIQSEGVWTEGKEILLLDTGVLRTP
jgi:hypothetical protein